MLVRLRDFAEVNRVSQRTVQICIKENYEVLGEHIDRRGKQGTWLDEFAVQFILEHIKLPNKDEVVVPTAREAALMEQITNLGLQLADAERRVSANAEAAGKVLLLEEAKKEQADKIDALTRDNAVKDKTLEEMKKTAQELSDELSEAKEDFEQLKGRNEITETNLKNVQDRLKKIEGTWWYKLFGGKKE